MLPKFENLRELAKSAIETGMAVLSENGEITPERARQFFLAMEAALPQLVDAPVANSHVAEAQKYKTIGGVKYPASDFLVVGEEQAPSTWHLQVKRNGIQDGELIEAAYNALLTPPGFSGEAYKGSDKDTAIYLLEEMYDSAIRYASGGMTGEDYGGNAILSEPYPNEHASRQNNPDKYVRVRRKNNAFGKGVHAIYGVRKDGKVEVQAIRFDAKVFTAEQAKKWLEEHEYKTTLEKATGKTREAAQVAEFDGSLQDYCRRVERAFLDAFPTQYDQTGRSVAYFYPTNIFNEDSDMGSCIIVIEYPGDVMYRVGYEETPDSGFEFADRSEWERVAHTYKVLGIEQPMGEETPTPAPEYEGETMEAAFSEDAQLSEIVEATVDVTAIADLAEAAIEMTGPRSPVSVEMTIVRAGPGNKRDKRYYTPQGLAASAGSFTGAQMFLTDHDPNALGENTKVGVITKDWWDDATKELRGIATIYDPNLAEKTRCRAASGQLNTMEVSILGNGQVRKGKVGGESYDLVEKILPGARVDFVSAAGAGGKVLALAESASGGEAEEQVAEVTPPAVLEQGAVLEILSETALPAKSVARLVAGEYTDEDALREAIRGETNAIVQETGSGKPTGGFTAQNQKVVSLQEARERSARVLAAHGFQPVRQ